MAQTRARRRQAPYRVQAEWAAAAVQAAVEDRAALRVAGQLSPAGGGLRALGAQLARLCPPGVHPLPAPAGFMRLLLSADRSPRHCGCSSIEYSTQVDALWFVSISSAPDPPALP